MSLRVYFDDICESLYESDLTLSYINKKLSVELFEKFKDKSNKVICYLPLAYALSKKYTHNNNLYNKTIFSVYECTISLRDYQITPFNTVFTQLQNERVSFVKGECGTGKTIFGISLSHKLKKVTAIIVHQDAIAKGWYKAFTKYSNAKIEIVEDDTLSGIADVYIIMIMRLKNISRAQLSCIGTMIVDEAKYLCTPVWSKLLLKIQPQYLIGLCAEDSRLDEGNDIINYYFGQKRVIMTNPKHFTVFKYETSFRPKIELQAYGKFKGRPRWDIIESSLYMNEYRCREIAAIAFRESSEHKIMIVCRLKNQAKLIYDILQTEMNYYNVALLIGSSTKCNNSQILITNRSKASIGFDAENYIDNYDGEPIDLVIVAMSIKLIEQTKGRGNRSKYPILVVFIDDYKTCRAHWEIQYKYYIENNATIITLSL